MKPLFLLSALLLSGCTTYNEHFDCEPGRGVGCKSLSEVNRLVDEGKLPLEETSFQKMTSEKGDKPETALPSIKTPKVLRVWVAGYTDEERVTHEPSVLRIPLQETAQ